jgi:hypothetical protein
MLTLFENQTQDLSEYERDHLVPAIVGLLYPIRGKEAALKSAEIVQRIKAKGLKIDDRRLRKAVGYIRYHGLLPCLCASERGYYVAATPEEVQLNIQSLEQRASENSRMAESLKSQIKRLFP